MITKDMVLYWLDDEYHKWLPEILTDILNSKNPNELYILKTEINEAWEQHLEAQ